MTEQPQEGDIYGSNKIEYTEGGIHRANRTFCAEIEIFLSFRRFCELIGHSSTSYGLNRAMQEYMVAHRNDVPAKLSFTVHMVEENVQDKKKADVCTCKGCKNPATVEAVYKGESRLICDSCKKDYEESKDWSFPQ